MLKKRLITIASLVKQDAKVLDVGTDHAYLPIYLYQNKISKQIIATDVSSKALEGAKRNLEKENIRDIKLICTDGLNGIDDQYDTLIISGMGTNTIIKILDVKELPNNIILSSNNELYELRKYMNKRGYKIASEIVVQENNQYYDIISYEKGFQKLTTTRLKFGISNDKDYYKYLYNKTKSIFKKANISKKISLIGDLLILRILTI